MVRIGNVFSRGMADRESLGPNIRPQLPCLLILGRVGIMVGE